MSTMQTAMKMALIRTMPLCLAPNGAAPGAHAGPARMIRIRAVAVSTSAAAPQVRLPPWLSFWCAFITAGKNCRKARRQAPPMEPARKVMSAMPPMPENTPAPRLAFGAGFIDWIEAAPRAAFAAFLALHFVVWTALPTLLYAILPLDLIEALI